MTNIASKNLYDLLGNDPDQDPELREPDPPTKAIDKPVARKGKRDGDGSDPNTGLKGRGGRQDAATGSERAFRDGGGRSANRSNDDGFRQERPDRLKSSEFRGGRGRGRGTRGGRGGPPRDDRHSKTGIADHEKQAAHGWGGQTGDNEWADEKAGEAIAKDEEKQGFDTDVPPPVNADGETPDADGADEKAEELEDKTKSYSAYLAEQAEKKLALGGTLETRKPNEGSKNFPEGKALNRTGDEEEYFAGSGGKIGRTREKKAKTNLQLEDDKLFKAPELGGGRGRGRGRGEGSFRGGEGRGRGGRGRGDRGGFESRGRGRGGRGGGPTVNVNDQSAFPSLGS